MNPNVSVPDLTRMISTKKPVVEENEPPAPKTPLSKSLGKTTPNDSAYQTSLTSWHSSIKPSTPNRESAISALIEEKRSNLYDLLKRLEPHTGNFTKEWLQDRLVFMERTWRNEIAREHEKLCRAEFRAGVKTSIKEEAEESQSPQRSEAADSSFISASPLLQAAERKKMKSLDLEEESTSAEGEDDCTAHQEL